MENERFYPTRKEIMERYNFNQNSFCASFHVDDSRKIEGKWSKEFPRHPLLTIDDSLTLFLPEEPGETKIFCDKMREAIGEIEKGISTPEEILEALDWVEEQTPGATAGIGGLEEEHDDKMREWKGGQMKVELNGGIPYVKIV